MATIRIGTASWTDPGFVEDWYPKSLPVRQRLRWYADHFDYVEVNSTFYALPAARTVERWCEETPDGFLFDIKLPKLLSRHSMPAKFLPPDLRAKIPVTSKGVAELTPESEQLLVKRLLRDVKPLAEAGKLGTFLLQLSPAFRPKAHRLGELDSLRTLLEKHSLAVELRNRDWAVGQQLERTVEYFKTRQIIFVLVDSPESQHFTVMPGLDRVTNPRCAYVRLHGRNERGYITGRTVAERFDYDYSDAEVKEIAERLRKIEAEVEELHVVANNNRSNYAPKLALRLRQALGLRERLRDALRRQTELF